MSEQRVWVSRKKLEADSGNPPMWHVEEDCYNLPDDHVEMSLSEAEEECVRQARCCSTIPALEDLD